MQENNTTHNLEVAMNTFAQQNESRLLPKYDQTKQKAQIVKTTTTTTTTTTTKQNKKHIIHNATAALKRARSLEGAGQ